MNSALCHINYFSLFILFIPGRAPFFVSETPAGVKGHVCGKTVPSLLEPGINVRSWASFLRELTFVYPLCPAAIALSLPLASKEAAAGLLINRPQSDLTSSLAEN